MIGKKCFNCDHVKCYFTNPSAGEGYYECALHGFKVDLNGVCNYCSTSKRESERKRWEAARLSEKEDMDIRFKTFGYYVIEEPIVRSSRIHSGR